MPVPHMSSTRDRNEYVRFARLAAGLLHRSQAPRLAADIIACPRNAVRQHPRWLKASLLVGLGVTLSSRTDHLELLHSRLACGRMTPRQSQPRVCVARPSGCREVGVGDGLAGDVVLDPRRLCSERH